MNKGSGSKFAYKDIKLRLLLECFGLKSLFSSIMSHLSFTG